MGGRVARDAKLGGDLMVRLGCKSLQIRLLKMLLDQNPLDRRRKQLLFNENALFWIKIRCAGVANTDFGPKSDAQASQTVTF